MDQTLLDSLLETAREAALAAGRIIREQYTKPRQITEKGPRDLVTDTDHVAQAAALAIIRSRFPDHGILAEEDSSNHPKGEGDWAIPRGAVWMVDPLDGTTNFTTGVPFSCASVGVAMDGISVAGAIYEPYRDEMFTAALGMGARLNGVLLPWITGVPLKRAIISVDWAHAPQNRKLALRTVDELAPLCQTVRSLGSAALAQCYVAAGRLQLYFNYGLQPWDLGAGSVIVREAGGEIQQPGGGHWILGQGAVFVGHRDLLTETQPLVSELIE
jgi:myo-inositol-1(or 4)-monophosphatase